MSESYPDEALSYHDGHEWVRSDFVHKVEGERDALREMLLAAQYDIDTIDPEMAQKLCDFYAAPPEEGRLDCGDDCEMCSGEYCTKHPHEACDCDVIDRHRPEEG